MAYTQNHYQVKGFEEEGDSIMAMHFKKQTRNQQYVTTGLRISDDCPDDSAKLRGSIDLTANRSVDDNDTKKMMAEGGLKRFTTNFHREANRMVGSNRTWFEIKPTVQYKINKTTRITTAVDYGIDKNKD